MMSSIAKNFLVLSSAMVSTACPTASAQTVEMHHSEVITARDVGPFHPTQRADLRRVARMVEHITNAFRSEHGREPLELNDELEQAAADFAEYMARTGRYGHYANGEAPSERVKKHGYDYCVVAENIAYDFQTAGFSTEKLAESLATGWKQSPEHRKNMLLPAAMQTAVAVVQSEQTGVYFAVQEFGRPKSAAIEFQIGNRSPAAIQYRLADQKYELLPRYVRRHTICQPEKLTLLQDHEAVATLLPADGERFTISGPPERLRIERETE